MKKLENDRKQRIEIGGRKEREWAGTQTVLISSKIIMIQYKRRNLHHTTQFNIILLKKSTLVVQKRKS